MAINTTVTAQQFADAVDYSHDLSTRKTAAEIENVINFDKWRRVFPYFNAEYKIYSDSIVNQASISSDTFATLTGDVISHDDYTKFDLAGTKQAWISALAGFRVSTAPSGATVPVIQSFYYDGQEIELQYRYVQGRYWIIADGELFTVQLLGSTVNQPRYFKHDFGSAKTRLIQVVSFQALRGGMVLESGAKMWPARIENKTLAIVGDSITAGTGASALGFAHRLQLGLGGVKCRMLGIGGSGYINNTANGRFIDRIDEATGQDYIMICGGINDLSTTVEGQTAQVSDFQNYVNAYYTALLLHYSGEQIIIVSNFTRGATVDGGKTTQYRDVLKNKANEIGAFFIDCIRDEESGGWITANNVHLLEDGTHPNDEGHELYKTNIIRSLMNLPLYL